MLNNFNNLRDNTILYSPALIISIVASLPLINIFLNTLNIDYEYINFLRGTSLFIFFFNSLYILLWVLPITFLLGVLSAYLVTFYKFPFVNFFKWALILSLAIPSYIFAFSLSSFFEFYGTGFLITSQIIGSSEKNFIPNISPIVGTISSLSLTLFGYVFILTKSSFLNQSQNLIDVGLNLGLKNLNIFFKIILPLARPSIFIGLSLVAMETLSDYGTVSFFGISTFTTGIYDSWFIFDDLLTANFLSICLLFFILIFFLSEKISRGYSKFFFFNTGKERQIKKIKLSGFKGLLALIFCASLFFLSFLFPLFQMIFWSFQFPEYFSNINLFNLNVNTLKIVILTSLILIILSVITNFSIRVLKSRLLNFISFFSVSGYAIPGIIISVSILSFLSFLDDFFVLNLKNIFIGTISGLVLGYFLRFYSISFNGIKASYLNINDSVDETSYLLGYKKYQTFFKVHFPFLFKNLILIFLLISIEVLKELPITLILRPFNFETFSTTAYNFASQDLIEASALPSLFLILWTSIFIIIYLKYSNDK